MVRLVVPEAQEARAFADAARLLNVPVRVVSRSGLTEAVRPDGYVAGRNARGDHVRLLDVLARALETEAHLELPEIATRTPITPKASNS